MWNRSLSSRGARQPYNNATAVDCSFARLPSRIIDVEATVVTAKQEIELHTHAAHKTACDRGRRRVRHSNRHALRARHQCFLVPLGPAAS